MSESNTSDPPAAAASSPTAIAATTVADTAQPAAAAAAAADPAPAAVAADSKTDEATQPSAATTEPAAATTTATATTTPTTATATAPTATPAAAPAAAAGDGSPDRTFLTSVHITSQRPSALPVPDAHASQPAISSPKADPSPPRTARPQQPESNLEKIARVESEMKEAEGKADYLTAERLRAVLSKLKAKDQTSVLSNLERAQRDDVSIFLRLVAEFQSKFDSEWSQRTLEQKLRADELIGTLKSRHEEEQRELYSVLTKKKIPKFSVTLLNLRKRQLSMAKAKHYVEAESCRQKADQLEAVEMEKIKEVAKSEYQSRFEKLLKRQAWDRESLANKLQIEKKCLLEAKAQDFLKLKKRLRNTEMELKKTHVRQRLHHEKRLVPLFSTLPPPPPPPQQSQSQSAATPQPGAPYNTQPYATPNALPAINQQRRRPPTSSADFGGQLNATPRGPAPGSDADLNAVAAATVYLPSNRPQTHDGYTTNAGATATLPAAAATSSAASSFAVPTASMGGTATAQAANSDFQFTASFREQKSATPSGVAPARQPPAAVVPPFIIPTSTQPQRSQRSGSNTARAAATQPQAAVGGAGSGGGGDYKQQPSPYGPGGSGASAATASSVARQTKRGGSQTERNRAVPIPAAPLVPSHARSAVTASALASAGRTGKVKSKLV